MNTETKSRKKGPIFLILALVTFGLCVFVSSACLILTYIKLATPEPLIYSGTGDRFLEIDKEEGPAIAHITGNSTDDFFQVIQRFKYSPDPTWTSYSLVYTFNEHEGFHLLDFLDEQQTYGFEIAASSSWEIEILPLSAAPELKIPGSYEGNGSIVILLDGNPKSATIDAEAGYFSLWVGSNEEYYSLVDTNDKYTGTLDLYPDIYILEIRAGGPWKIQIYD